jgi:glycine/D-amino acid oxidase-like deaminating enzyme
MSAALSVWAADISRRWYASGIKDGTLKIANHGVGRACTPTIHGVLPAEEARFRTFVRAICPRSPTRRSSGHGCAATATFDGDFWIAPDPERRLDRGAGDSGHAFKFAPVLGGLIADVVEGTPNPWAQRFRWRARGRDATEAARATVPTSLQHSGEAPE